MSFLFLFTAFTIIYCIQKIICSSDEPDQNHFFCKSTVDMHRHDLDTQHFTWTEKKTIFSGLGICSLALRSFGQNPKNLRATMSDSLRSVLTKERPWANCSGCSYLKSDLERFAQVAHNKRATWANCSKTSDSLEEIRKNGFFEWTVFPLLSQKVHCSCRSLLICSFLKSNHEQFSLKKSDWEIR